MVDTSQNGWPLIPAYLDPRLGTLDAVSGRSNVLNGDVLEVFTAFCKDFAAEVMPIDREQSWGFAPRQIHGATTWSNHASGTAIDLNANTYPMFAHGYTDAQITAVHRLLARYPVVRWGGDFPPARVDEMHFEINVSPAELAKFVTTMKEPKMVDNNAVAAKALSYVGKAQYSGMCEMFTRTCFGFSAKYASALRAYNASLAKGGFHAGDMNPPPGVPVFWDITSGRNAQYDHDAVSVGGGYVVSTSAGPNKTIARIKISELTTKWGMKYRGWGEWYHDQRVYSPPATANPQPSTPATSDAEKDRNKVVQSVLKGLGYYNGHIDGIDGPMQKAAVVEYQTTQNANGAAGLVVDGYWGSKTDAWYNWVKDAQRALNAFKGVDIAVDGDYGNITKGRVWDVQSRNGLRKDGILGPIMVAWMQSKGSSIPSRP